MMEQNVILNNGAAMVIVTAMTVVTKVSSYVYLYEQYRYTKNYS